MIQTAVSRRVQSTLPEVSSKRLASIAGRVLNGGRYSPAEVATLAASVLTQAANVPRARGAKPVGATKAAKTGKAARNGPKGRKRAATR